MLDGVTFIDNQAAASVFFLSVTVSEAVFKGEVYNTTPPEGMMPHPQDRPIAELWALAGQIFFVPVEVSENWKERNILLSQAQRVENELPKRDQFIPKYGMNELVLYERIGALNAQCANDPLPTYGRGEVVLAPVGDLDIQRASILAAGMRQLRTITKLSFH